MDKTIILADLDNSLSNLEKTITGFIIEGFNRSPSATAWSPAQIVEHLLLLERIAMKAINGATIPTNRAADSKVGLIKWAMEDETKRLAPGIVVPSDTTLNAQQLIQQIQQERQKIKTSIASADITEACTEFKHPVLGTLTRFEWLYFIIYHTERHRKQIERIKKN